MGPTWVLSAPGGAHVGPMNLVIWGVFSDFYRALAFIKSVLSYYSCLQLPVPLVHGRFRAGYLVPHVATEHMLTQQSVAPLAVMVWQLVLLVPTTWRTAQRLLCVSSLIARFMGPTWGPSGTDKTQVGPMLAPWTLLSKLVCPQKQWACGSEHWYNGKTINVIKIDIWNCKMLRLNKTIILIFGNGFIADTSMQL